MSTEKTTETPARPERTQPASQTGGPAGAQQAAQTRIKWDDTNMHSAYANVCNVSSTQEEVVLMFGINQAWNAAQREVTVQLSDRVILSPFAAKRLVNILNNVMREYENRFGEVKLPGQG